MTETLSYLLKHRIHVKDRIKYSRGERRRMFIEDLIEVNSKIEEAKQRRTNDEK